MDIGQLIGVAIIVVLVIWFIGAFILDSVRDKRNAKAKELLLSKYVGPSNEIDLDTGMPVLPEGFHWQVEFGEEQYSKYRNHIYLSIRHGKAFAYMFSQPVMWINDFNGEETSVPLNELKAFTQSSAVTALDKLLHDNKKRIERLNRDSILKSIEGSYPPKKLEL